MSNKILNLKEFNHDSVESAFKELVEEKEMKLGKLAQPVRVALTGSKESPGIYDVVLLLGREKTCARLNEAIEAIAAG